MTGRKYLDMELIKEHRHHEYSEFMRNESTNFDEGEVCIKLLCVV